MSQSVFLNCVADGLLLDVFGMACLAGGAAQGAPLLVMGVTLSVVQLAKIKLNQYTSQGCLKLQKCLSGERVKKFRVLAACFSLLVCEISIPVSVIVAFVVAILTAVTLPVVLAQRQKKVKKVFVSKGFTPPPAGFF